jgi:hypothetical protein
VPLPAATASFALFDYFRVPYRVETDGAPTGSLGNAHGRVVWPAPATGPRGLWWLGTIPFYATLADAADLADRRRTLGGSWTDGTAIHDAGGNVVATIARSDGNTLLLPFDPADAMVSAWSEAYATERAASAKSRVKTLAMRGYYAARPAMPRPAQLALRRAFSRIQARSAFPRWPVEPGLHDLYSALHDLVAESLGGPLPALAPWPDGKSWALVLTHDVEHSAGYESIAAMRDLETRLGYRSAWYLVPERDYLVDDEVVTGLREGGFEVGVHGLHHDGRDLVGSALAERLPAMQRWRDRWHATGFRSPATHRDWNVMPDLGFDYDSSSFDTDPFEPQAGGCCTWLPFENRGLVELPMTLTMDSTAFVILRRGAQLWNEKADLLRSRGGMAMLLTHPDYMGDDDRLAAYAAFLERYADDELAWRALPNEVSAWWRRRSASWIESSGADELRVAGPAAGDARIVYLGELGHHADAGAGRGQRGIDGLDHADDVDPDLRA